jgi:hypothetical protein
VGKRISQTKEVNSQAAKGRKRGQDGTVSATNRRATHHRSSETHPQSRVSKMVTDLSLSFQERQANDPQDQRESDYKNRSAEVDPPFPHGI